MDHQESEPKSEEEKSVAHYASTHQILLVGEGDFSFALSLALSFASASNICASSLDVYDDVVTKYSKSRSNLEKLWNLGASLLHGVDATKMKFHPDLRMRKFDIIIFNFPHAGFHGKEDTNRMIKMHRRVVSGFFGNASGMLRANGEVHVNHKTTEPFSKWNIEELASFNSLVLTECVKFNSKDYPGYENKRGDGLRRDKPFHLGKCSTFKFQYFRDAKMVYNAKKKLNLLDGRLKRQFENISVQANQHLQGYGTGHEEQISSLSNVTQQALLPSKARVFDTYRRCDDQRLSIPEMPRPHYHSLVQFQDLEANPATLSTSYLRRNTTASLPSEVRVLDTYRRSDDQRLSEPEMPKPHDHSLVQFDKFEANSASLSSNYLRRNRTANLDLTARYLWPNERATNVIGYNNSDNDAVEAYASCYDPRFSVCERLIFEKIYMESSRGASRSIFSHRELEPNMEELRQRAASDARYLHQIVRPKTCVLAGGFSNTNCSRQEANPKFNSYSRRLARSDPFSSRLEFESYSGGRRSDLARPDRF